MQESNDIGTTYLRAQLLAEPSRTSSLDLLTRYADLAVDLANQVPDSDRFKEDVTQIADVQRELWSVAGDAVRADPDGTAPRLYIETLNAMIDTHNDRVTSLRNRVPSTVLVLQVVGSAVAVGVLSLYLALLGRGLITSLVDHHRRDPHPVHLLRPRPTAPRPDHGPRRCARRGTGGNEPTTGRHGALSADRAWSRH